MRRVISSSYLKLLIPNQIEDLWQNQGKKRKKYDHVKYIFKKILKQVNCGKKSNRRSGMKQQLSLKIAPKERPYREDIIDSSIKYKGIKL